MGGLEGPPKPPIGGSGRPGEAVAPFDSGAQNVRGLEGPPKPPALGDGPAEPGRPSIAATCRASPVYTP
jgi:hypothetical protein